MKSNTAAKQSTNQVAKNTKTIYRAVGLDELADIFQSGQLRSKPGGGTLEVKLFAETLEDAFQQGMQLHPSKPFALLKIEITIKCIINYTKFIRILGYLVIGLLLV